MLSVTSESSVVPANGGMINLSLLHSGAAAFVWLQWVRSPNANPDLSVGRIETSDWIIFKSQKGCPLSVLNTIQFRHLPSSQIPPGGVVQINICNRGNEDAPVTVFAGFETF